MTASVPFEVQIGHHGEERTFYLPYGTRTLRIEVKNSTGRPQKLWLRPERTPAEYPATLIYGHGDEDDDLWIHWAGGDETGACVKTDEKSPLRDRDLKVWEVIPVALEKGETRSAFINVTHLFGDVKPRTLTLRAITMEAEEERPLDSTLKVHLDVPSAGNAPVQNPVRGVWNDTGTRLEFTGAQLANYVSRWWPPDELSYTDTGDLPSRLALHLKDNKLTLTLDAGADGTGGATLTEVKDHDWEAGQDVLRLRPTIPELFHFCDNQHRYYVVRLWFLWLDKRIGRKHEVPDAERIDVVFDAQAKSVPFMGTDFHYKETWGRLKPNEKIGKIELGLGVSSLDDFAKRTLASFLAKSKEANPAEKVADELCGVQRRQKGPQAHVPLLTNVDVFRHITSPDVREG